MDQVNRPRVDRSILRVGDLVRHDTKEKADGTLKEIFEDWGWMPDFSIGIVMDIKENDGGNYAKVYYMDINSKDPAPSIDWYPLVQLRNLCERR
jgi:hypothetical protein